MIAENNIRTSVSSHIDLINQGIRVNAKYPKITPAARCGKYTKIK